MTNWIICDKCGRVELIHNAGAICATCGTKYPVIIARAASGTEDILKKPMTSNRAEEHANDD